MRFYGKLVILMIAVAALSYAVFAPPPGPRTMSDFDPNRMAALETRMWEAYYDQANIRLFGLLATMLREQYHYSWAVAFQEAFHLARAASRFSNLRSNYDSVLPDLETAYARAHDWVHGDFDPKAVARAELAWWVARRTPGQNSPQQIADLIASEYALLYTRPRQMMLESAAMRADAAALRDAHADHPDWDTVKQLLEYSYRELYAALSARMS
jgi:hypothetical protein